MYSRLGVPSTESSQKSAVLGHARAISCALTHPCAYRCRHHTRRSHAFLTHPMPRNMQGRSARSVARTQRYEQEPSAPAAALARDGSATARVRERRANSGTDVQHAIAANHTRPIMLPLYAGPAHHAYQAHRAQKLRFGRTFHHEDPETVGRRPDVHGCSSSCTRSLSKERRRK